MTQPTKPNQPTPEAVLAAIETLAVQRYDWREIVSSMEGEDARLHAVVDLARALNGFASAVAQDFYALAIDEKKRAEKSDDWMTRKTSYAQSIHASIMASMADAYAGGVEESHDRQRDLQRELERCSAHMGQDEYNESEYSV